MIEFKFRLKFELTVAETHWRLQQQPMQKNILDRNSSYHKLFQSYFVLYDIDRMNLPSVR